GGHGQVGAGGEPAPPRQPVQPGRGGNRVQAPLQGVAAGGRPVVLAERDDDAGDHHGGQNMPVSSRAASDIMCWFHGGSNTSSTSASAMVGISSSASRTSATRMSPMPQPGAVRVMRTLARYSPSFSGCGSSVAS